MRKPLLALCLLAGPAFAANTPLDFGKHNADEPINVSADAFLADIKGKTGTYSGNVIVTQGNLRLRADKVRVNVIENKPDKIEATGHVVFDSSSGTAQGDVGVYDVGPRTITLNGHVVLAKDKNVMRGTTLVVNLVTGAATLQSKGANGGRVQGLFTPPPQRQSQSLKPASTNP
ncbi:MAG TPA: lipopolysaccharide transport periplasmic protein LptA [Rhizomicrobium sp.]|nr:lipopolysaccharide transport periplasmic protein LptA [Rhizomicrobium sp.]